jgi:simple sugar transport system substrate-binding protein
MKSGAITRGFLWNPIDSGYAMVALGKVMASGAEIKDGIDVPGMGPCQVDASTQVIRANKQIDLNPESIDQWAEII